MKISDIVFDQVGCCGSHPRAEIRHVNGFVSHIEDGGDGSVTVTTFCANFVESGAVRYATDTAFNARMQADAAL